MQTWLTTAKHPRWNRPYTELAYQPMLEVLQYLRANGYKTYIVTGGGQDFARMGPRRCTVSRPSRWSEPLGPKYSYDRDGKPILTKEPKLTLSNDFGGKPEGIHLMIGRRPYAAFGNSTGDQQMLEYAGAGDGARLMMLVLHDDAQREYAYGPARACRTPRSAHSPGIVRRSEERRLVSDQHEERLEAHICIRVVLLTMKKRVVAALTIAALWSSQSLELSKEAENPVTRYITLPLRYEADVWDGANKTTKDVFDVDQAVVPFRLNDDWSLITRTKLPSEVLPPKKLGDPWVDGLSNGYTTFFLSRSTVRAFIGVRPVSIIRQPPTRRSASTNGAPGRQWHSCTRTRAPGISARSSTTSGPLAADPRVTEPTSYWSIRSLAIISRMDGR